jgi:DNA-binding response OmpR family regulator
VEPEKCILIVDDEPNVRLVLKTALESVGYRVAEAEDAQSALDRLSTASAGKSASCDLILLDLQMPKMNGIELLTRLRGSGSVVPVVILTAHGSIPDAVAAMKLGAIDFLTKPITPDALRRAVAEVLDRHAPSPAATCTGAPYLDRGELAKRVAFDLARAKRALNRGQFSEAEPLLRELIALDPRSAEAAELLDRLLTLKEQEERGSFRILRDWFPSGKARLKS